MSRRRRRTIRRTNIALEKLVEAGLEIPRLTTLDSMASTVQGHGGYEYENRVKALAADTCH